MDLGLANRVHALTGATLHCLVADLASADAAARLVALLPSPAASGSSIAIDGGRARAL